MDRAGASDRLSTSCLPCNFPGEVQPGFEVRLQNHLHLVADCGTATACRELVGRRQASVSGLLHSVFEFRFEQPGHLLAPFE
jgi:hypothetical protein